MSGNQLEILYNEERELTERETINLNSKKNSIPVEYLRKNLFNATTRESKELKRMKTIYDDGINKIQVNRSLHQKHRDLLSILFTDNNGIESLKNGSSIIKTSLYHNAKEMGYENPKDGTSVIKSFLWDLENTKFIFTKKNGTDYEEQSHSLIGNHTYSSKYDSYIITIPSDTNKFKILNFAVEIPKEINRKIVSIPNKFAKTKALVSYILSNKALTNGISFESICDKLDIDLGSRKSEFKKELKENKDLLKDFNITYNEESCIIKYEQLEDIKFHRGMKPMEILEIIDKEKEKELELEELVNFGFRKSRFVGKYIKHKSNGLFGEEIVTSKIADIETKLEDNIRYYRFKLHFDNHDNVFSRWHDITTIENLEQNWMSGNSDF